MSPNPNPKDSITRLLTRQKPDQHISGIAGFIFGICMLIDIYDSIGIQEPDTKSDAAGLRFEAAWSPMGALCVAHTRVPENMTLKQLANDCSRLVKMSRSALPSAISPPAIRSLSSRMCPFIRPVPSNCV